MGRGGRSLSVAECSGAKAQCPNGAANHGISAPGGREMTPTTTGEQSGAGRAGAGGENGNGGGPELVPARMINEYVFCPRLFYLEWVQGEWADNAYTEDGKVAHRRADRATRSVPEPEQEQPTTARSVELSAPILGVSGRIDVVEAEAGEVSPIDYKRGSPPDIPEKAWEPERVQVCAYALALRENGYRVSRGYIYFAGARQRVEVPIDGALEAKTRQAIAGLRACAASALMPPPLHHSPKCAGCSLNGICLPDEIGMLRGDPDEIRLLFPPRDDALPVYVNEQGARVGISNQVLQVHRKHEHLVEVRLGEVSQLCIYGNVGLTTPALRALCAAQVPTALFSYGGWFYGKLEGHWHKNIEIRRAQYRAAEDRGFCLRLAKRIVAAKVANCRTLVRRNHAEGAPKSALDELEQAARRAEEAEDLEELLGIEGNAARAYFSAMPGMLKPPGGAGDGELRLDFEKRTRRPPTDPVNALLSFCYALLTKDMTIAASLSGFDPLLGFYHQPRYGRPALALDLMEEFRPLIADSVVLQVINNGVIKAGDFVRNSLGVAIAPAARKRLIEAYERRMDQLVTHPVFGYRVSYRRVLSVQARLLGRHLLGEIDSYPEFVTR
jgi:CRISPR-associated protein Cas1